jgi:hypothetical protein
MNSSAGVRAFYFPSPNARPSTYPVVDEAEEGQAESMGSMDGSLLKKSSITP